MNSAFDEIVWYTDEAEIAHFAKYHGCQITAESTVVTPAGSVVGRIVPVLDGQPAPLGLIVRRYRMELALGTVYTHWPIPPSPNSPDIRCGMCSAPVVIRPVPAIGWNPPCPVTEITNLCPECYAASGLPFVCPAPMYIPDTDFPQVLNGEYGHLREPLRRIIANTLWPDSKEEQNAPHD